MNAGLHVNADHFLMEVIDPETGEPVNEGERGELVFTTLTKEAFPILRFRTKDLASYTEEKCECGRALPRHSRIIGRSDDRMKIKGVLVFPTQIEDVLMKIEGVSENYQREKYTKGPFTNLRIKVEPSVERMKAGNLDSLAKQIEEEIYATLNLKLPVEILSPFTLRREEGKAKRILDLTK